jgi:hypothetical protein
VHAVPWAVLYQVQATTSKLSAVGSKENDDEKNPRIDTLGGSPDRLRIYVERSF